MNTRRGVSPYGILGFTSRQTGLVCSGYGLLWVGMFLATYGLPSIAQAQSTPVTAGYRDFNFGATPSSEPTSEKPESKLWWNDGLWWGSLWNPAANRYEIYRFDAAAQNWLPTGTAIDSRTSSRADALWDGQRLYLASHVYSPTPGPTTSSNASRLYRYTYNAATKTYSLDAGFPINISSSKAEALVLDKDSTGKLWVTWAENGKIKINRSLGDDLTWGTPFDLPVQGNDTDLDDISTLVAFGGNKIGVLWSNQKDSSDYFAVHQDGDADTVWQPRETALPGLGLGRVAEDHLNLKAATDGSGDLYAAVLTNLSGASSTGIFVLKRSPSAGWSRHVFATVNMNHSRPQLLVDHESQRLFVFTRSTDTGPGAIYMKSAGLSDLVFPAGLGTPIMASATDLNMTNPTSTKQSVNSTTGMLVLAADKDSRYYLHHYSVPTNNIPSLASFTPAHGPAGTAITITGSRFTGSTGVKFNGISVTSFSINSDTLISTTVPADATNGKITVTNAFGVGSSATDYLVTAPPIVSAFAPSNGPVGTPVTITGNNFLGTTSVKFNGTVAPGFIIDSNTQLRANVPAGATTGPISVTNGDGSAESSNVFMVTATPSISSFSPIRALAGAQIAIKGNRFSGATAVSFNGMPAAFNFVADTLIQATVPVGTTTGKISITNSAGTGTSDSSFIVQHTLTVANTGSGSVNVNPAGGVYDENAVVTVTAIPATGWEFYDWGGDLNGSSATMNLTMNTNKQITAKFRAIAQYTVTINAVGAGSVTLDPPGGIYYVGTVVTLTATPAAGYVFSGYSGDFKGWMDIETITVNANKNLTATFSPQPAPRYATGIWTSAGEVSQLPASGLRWDNMKAEADAPMGLPNLSDNEDSVGVAILAKALVYARTGDAAYRQAVISACMAAIGTELDGDALAFGRELLPYVLAADLVGLPASEDTTFHNWLRHGLTLNLKGQTLRSANESRPNNWGTRCGATRAAVAKYLGDATELERSARVFKGWLGDRATYADFSFDNDMTWHPDSTAPVGINPLGSTIQGHSVDGVLPEDQRRSGPFTWPPPKENYVYGALQGALMEAIILYRAGYDVWNWENQALRRAMKWLYEVDNYIPDGDDEWLPHIINHFYKTNFLSPFPAKPGKNAGWTDWLYGAKYALTISKNNGNVELHSLGAINDSLAVVKLEAIPDSNYLFNGWSGDHSGIKNPDTLVMNANKNVIANFVKAGPFTVTVTTVGSGTVTLNPPGGVYAGGTIVAFTAAPAPGFKFTGWSGDLTGSTNPASLMITANRKITATFKAVYTLTTNVTGAGTITLNPPAGPYDVGTVVTLTATPASGSQFVEWSGALSGVTNPGTLTMNANKTVTATFTPIGIVHWGTKTGGSSNSATVATSSGLTAAPNHLYLAAITTKSKVKVNEVKGLGLTWKLVKTQCSGRNNIGVELWMAQGAPTGNGIVTATLAAAATNAVIAVSRYSGVATVNPLSQVISGNTKGLDGLCSGGVDSWPYAFNMITTVNGAMVHVAAADRNRTHTPGKSYTERAEMRQGSSSTVASVSIENRVVPVADTVLVNGVFSGNTDWAVIAVEIKPLAVASPALAPVENDSVAAAELPARAQLLPNYPNPFNPTTMIAYALPSAMHVTLKVYNLTGQVVATLIDGEQPAGHHAVNFNASHLPSGYYFVVLQIPPSGVKQVRRIVLMK